MKAESVYHETKEKGTDTHESTWVDGMRAGTPIAIGYIPVAIAFGLLAKSSGIPNYVSILMSLFVFAGASQFVGVNLLALGTAYGEIILTTFILNLRHFLMSAALSQRMESMPRIWGAVLSFGITDESFTMAALRKERKLTKEFILGLNLTGFVAWNIGTWIGVFLAAGLPPMLQASMGIALYAMFIGLLVPSVRTSRIVCVVALCAMALHSALDWLPYFVSLSTGWRIIIATVTAAALGAILFPEDEQEGAKV
ncbi:AzlC family ABC transporter permease [Aneurinibacillus sp. REN35]|uniref:AzlC family ABC transporter permease n=1 Tax=Aneurinibacillus sp. REN35 TaxID=3237286 RepID=UPI0035277556